MLSNMSKNLWGFERYHVYLTATELTQVLHQFLYAGPPPLYAFKNDFGPQEVLELKCWVGGDLICSVSAPPKV